jgi:hypothetical protein
MRSSLFSLGIVLAISLQVQPSGAQQICTIDHQPAATLLLPYFEVDLNSAGLAESAGKKTLMAVSNGKAAPGSKTTLRGDEDESSAVLAHVVIWSDLSVPVLDFNIYLTSYDVQTINLWEILNGKVPRTASVGQDPGDLISPKGAFSQDIDFASCNGQLPPPMLPDQYREHLRAALTGKFSALLNGCAGLDYGDNIARGYVTIDVVNNCTLRFPGDAGYFVSGGTGDATNQNVLVGDYFYLDDRPSIQGGGFASGDVMVPIQAHATNPETSVAGQYTFYGRYEGWTAADNREPLATNFAVRYINSSILSWRTKYIVWRDSKVDQGAFKCGTLPAWYPLAQEQVLVFDEQETPELIETPPFSPPPPGEFQLPFPAEARSAMVDGEDFPVSFDAGWMFLNLNTFVAAAGANPPEDPTAAQAWVHVVMDAAGRFSVGLDAIQLDSACKANHSLIGGL